MGFIQGVFKIREHFSGPTRDLNLNIWGGILDIGIKKKKTSPDDSKGQNPGMSETVKEGGRFLSPEGHVQGLMCLIDKSQSDR